MRRTMGIIEILHSSPGKNLQKSRPRDPDVLCRPIAGCLSSTRSHGHAARRFGECFRIVNGARIAIHSLVLSVLRTLPGNEDEKTYRRFKIEAMAARHGHAMRSLCCHCEAIVAGQQRTAEKLEFTPGVQSCTIFALTMVPYLSRGAVLLQKRRRTAGEETHLRAHSSQRDPHRT